MFRFELGSSVKAPGIAGRIVARADYEDGRVMYCVRARVIREGEAPAQLWAPEADVVADVADPEPPAP